MGKPDTRRLDREIRATTRKLEAAEGRQMWPLTGRERRALLAAAASGSVKVARGKSGARSEEQATTTWNAATTRLNAEIAALQVERQRVVNEAAKAKAAKKSSGWF
ncbi:hypothetical protein ACFQ7F_08270 [Streptomyces sp. NPDC056486]|uniref:hypothetical protein n=1 Tax=Streptomyces sp. NPDC056486 TaxID=3345835 RepID=UPI0036B02BD5